MRRRRRSRCPAGRTAACSIRSTKCRCRCRDPVSLEPVSGIGSPLEVDDEPPLELLELPVVPLPVVVESGARRVRSCDAALAAAFAAFCSAFAAFAASVGRDGGSRHGQHQSRDKCFGQHLHVQSPPRFLCPAARPILVKQVRDRTAPSGAGRALAMVNAGVGAVAGCKPSRQSVSRVCGCGAAAPTSATAAGREQPR